MMPRKIATRIVRTAYDPAYGSEREQLARELSDWHGGPMSGLFAVSNSWLQGGEAAPEDIGMALDELQSLLDRGSVAINERQHVEGLVAKLRATLKG